MKAICIWSSQIGNPFFSVQEVADGATGEDIVEYCLMNSGWREDIEEGHTSREELGLEFFYIHPVFAVLFRSAKVPDFGSDGINHVLGNYMVNVCEAFKVPESFSLTDTEFFKAMEQFEGKDIALKGS